MPTSPWVQRALRHEIMAQPRGEIMASRKYTGVTRNAEADLPIESPVRDDAAFLAEHVNHDIGVVVTSDGVAAFECTDCAPDELPDDWADGAYYSDGSLV